MTELEQLVALVRKEFVSDAGMKEYIRIGYAENYIPHLSVFYNGYINYSDGKVTRTKKFTDFFNKTRAIANKMSLRIEKVSLAGNRNNSSPRLDIMLTLDGASHSYRFTEGASRYSSDPNDLDYYIATMHDVILQEMAQWCIKNSYKSNIRNSKIVQAFIKKKADSECDTLYFNWWIKLLNALGVSTKPIVRDDNLYTVRNLPNKYDELKEIATSTKSVLAPAALQSYLLKNKHAVTTSTNTNNFESSSHNRIPHYNGNLFREYYGSKDESPSIWLTDLANNTIDIIDGEIKHKDYIVKDIVPLYEQKFVDVMKDNMIHYRLTGYNAFNGTVSWTNGINGATICYGGKVEYGESSSLTQAAYMCERLGLMDDLVTVLAQHTHKQVIQDLMVHALEGRITYMESDGSQSYPIRKLITMIADKQEGK